MPHRRASLTHLRTCMRFSACVPKREKRAAQQPPGMTRKKVLEMTLSPTQFYDSSELLPIVRELLSRNPEMSGEEMTCRLGAPTHDVTAVLEVLRIDGQVQP